MNAQQAKNILYHAKRIGIVRTDKLGDMVLTLPLAHALHSYFPGASVEMIAQQYVAPLVENSSVLSAVHYTNTQSLHDILQANTFDALFFPRMRDKECFTAMRNRVPLRVGSGYRWYSWMLNYRIKQHRKTAEHHEAEYNVAMLGSILGINITPQLVAPYISETQRRNISEILQQHGVTINEPYIILHPGSGGSAHDWQPERFGEVARLFLQHRSMQIVVTGIESERELCNQVVAHSPTAINLCGTCNLTEVIALAENAKLLVANSTGVLHIAASLGTPVVGLYPNTTAISARRWGPYSKQSRAVSPPIGDDMALITTDLVLQAMLQLL